MRLALTICLLLFFSASDAQDDGFSDSTAYSETHTLVPPAELQSTKDYQNQRIAVRKFDEDSWRRATKGVSYAEEEEKELPEPPKLNAPNLGWLGPVIQVVAYILIGCGVLLMVYFLLKNLGGKLSVRRRVEEIDVAEGPLEAIAAINTRSMLDEAIRSGDFKLAIRLYYLELLKQLDANGIIKWKRDKTNKDYLAELFSKNYFFDDIRRLTTAYETIWYGEHDIESQVFQRLSARFEGMLTSISTRTEA